MAKPANGWHRKTAGTPAELARRRRYDSAEHKAARKAGAALVAAGRARCWRCGVRLAPGGWQVGHNDAGTVIMGPECLPCQRGHAARKGAKVANAIALSVNGGGRCSNCGGPFARRNGTQRFCSTECRIAKLGGRRPAEPKLPKIRPPRGTQAAMNACAVCGALTLRLKYCSDGCMWEGNARQARNRHRAEVGREPDDRPTKKWAGRVDR